MPSPVALVVVAAGRGLRLGGSIPKQYLPCAGKPLLTHTLERLAAAAEVGSITVVIHPDDREHYDTAVAALSAGAAAKLTPPAQGGATRQESVGSGLEALAGRAPEIVLIHDGARPFPSKALIGRAVTAARAHGAAIPGVAVTDTLKQVEASGRIVGAADRSVLRAVQTPQAFRYELILEAHRRFAGADLTDDAALAERAGHAVHVFEGEPGNRKVTTMEDLKDAEARLTPAFEVRVGQGFDVHAFEPGDHVWLCGVRIPHDKKLSGHSDADVGLHALADAIYGALGDGDIGSHFPPSDPQWRGAASWQFLAHAVGRVRARGGEISHLDVTLVCEAPKVGPHREAMRARMAEIAGVSLDRTAVKATTSEQLGFTGRREGMVAYALATVRLPVA